MSINNFRISIDLNLRRAEQQTCGIAWEKTEENEDQLSAGTEIMRRWRSLRFLFPLRIEILPRGIDSAERKI